MGQRPVFVSGAAFNSWSAAYMIVMELALDCEKRVVLHGQCTLAASGTDTPITDTPGLLIVFV
jgi:hypothetical protein